MQTSTVKTEMRELTPDGMASASGGLSKDVATAIGTGICQLLEPVAGLGALVLVAGWAANSIK